MGKVTAYVLHFAVPAAFAWAVVILAGSLLDVSALPLDWVPQDKLLHACAYGLLAWFIGVSSLTESDFCRWIDAVGLAVGFGMIVEILQATVNRQPSLGDVVADLVGALSLAAIGWISERRSKW